MIHAYIDIKNRFEELIANTVAKSFDMSLFFSKGINEGLISRLYGSSLRKGFDVARVRSTTSKRAAIINYERDVALTSLIFIISIGIHL